MADNSPTDQQFERIIELLSKIANEDPKDTQAKSDEKRRAKKHLKALTDNGLALVGLSRGMLSLSKVVGDQLAMNSRLAEALGQTANTLKGAESVMKRFITGQQSFAQKVKITGDLLSLGMTEFSNKTWQFGSQLKVLGLQNKTAFQLIRANTQGLGLSEDASLRLVNELATTAAESKDSISSLIDAINGMRDAMVSTTVELGPKTALNAQKIAAMMAQGNSELQEASAKFVKSFLSGSDGYMKAARLGVRFEEGESLSSMARKFETILGKVQGLQAGKRGAGSQFFFDAMEQGFALSRADFNLQRQIGTSIDALAEGNVHALSRASARINLQQSMSESLDGIQSKLTQLAEAAAKGFNLVKDKIIWLWTEMKNRWGEWNPVVKGVVGAGGVAASIWIASKIKNMMRWMRGFGSGGGGRSKGTYQQRFGSPTQRKYQSTSEGVVEDNKRTVRRTGGTSKDHWKSPRIPLSKMAKGFKGNLLATAVALLFESREDIQEGHYAAAVAEALATFENTMQLGRPTWFQAWMKDIAESLREGNATRESTLDHLQDPSPVGARGTLLDFGQGDFAPWTFPTQY